ncbi:MAG: LITAF-like zinc ribbon domain-containing protein [Limisphaerales bacterium]
MNLECPYCGSRGVARCRGLHSPAEIVICLLLCLLLFLPGIIYYIWTESRPFCSGCGRRVGQT